MIKKRPHGYNSTYLSNKVDDVDRLIDILENSDINTIYDASLGPQHFWVDGYLQVADVSSQAWRAGENIVLDADPSGVTISVNPVLTNIATVDFSLGYVPSTHIEAHIHWNSADHTLNIPTEVDGVSVQVGQEQLARARNIEGSGMINGQPVFAVGSSGNRPTIKLANNSSPATSLTAIGLTTQSIGNNQTGYVNTFGMVRDVCTSEWGEGSLLWLDSVNGGLTDVRPPAPDMQYAMGIVIRSHASVGSIFVKPVLVARLAWLSDVSARGYQNDGDTVVWRSDCSIWEPRPNGEVKIGTPASSSAIGNQGQTMMDASYYYLCTNVNTWGRVLLDYAF